jgi:tRNA A-37 threonylcarbamoyl transferase component Bud32
MINTFIKRIPIDQDYANEVDLQNVAAVYGFCPCIIDVEITDTECIVTMEYLGDGILADIYGEDPSNVPVEVWDDIRRIVTILYEIEGIEYPDITPYNFIKVKDKIYIIDFGDAKYRDKETNWFLAEFMDGENSWNPDYK